MEQNNQDTHHSLLSEHGFQETPFEIQPYLGDDENSWHLLKNGRSILNHPPQPFPLTYMEKAWLLAIQQDSRFTCFSDTFIFEEINPLFNWQDYQYFDQYQSTDTFEGDYVIIFQTILHAIIEKQLLELTYLSGKKTVPTKHIFQPLKIEYSIKNNKFRLLAKRKVGKGWRDITFNISDILAVEHCLTASTNEHFSVKQELSSIVCLLKDERSALERATFHFSNYRKTIERADELYRITIYYEKKDETELLINILSFGARLKVIEPDSFVQQIKYRLRKQLHRSQFPPNELLF